MLDVIAICCPEPWWFRVVLVSGFLGPALRGWNHNSAGIDGFWPVCSVVVPDLGQLWRNVSLWQEPEGLRTIWVACSCCAEWAVEDERAWCLLAFFSIRPGHLGDVAAAEVGWISFVGVIGSGLKDLWVLKPVWYRLQPSYLSSHLLLIARCSVHCRTSVSVTWGKNELDINCFFSKFSCVLSVVMADLIAVMFIPSFMKTREMGDHFPRAISHAIGLLEENISLQRPFPTASLNVCLTSAKAPFHWCKFAGLCWPTGNVMVILSPDNVPKRHIWHF